LFAIATVSACTLLLAACASGGGGLVGVGISKVPGPSGGGGSGSGGTTSEELANFGLTNINAFAAYAAGATGQGVKVAVVDTGIDVDHPDLITNIDSASTDIVTGTRSAVAAAIRRGMALDDVIGHGTNVSGVIGALKNGVGTHGVAYQSSIVAIRADNRDSSCSTGCFTDADIAASIDHAVANGAKIINLSLGGAPPNTAVLETALQNAVNAGVIIVAASGNEGKSTPDAPASFAGTTAAKGLALAVGATDKDNAASVFHNRAGSSATFFLVAPGVDIVTTEKGGGTATVSGTSFSAPHVAGALALLLDLFPSLTPAQAVDLILRTATDLGSAGTDQIFGRGLVNLAEASKPQGTASVPTSTTVSGSSSTLASTTLNLGSAFGNSLTQNSFLQEAIILDDYERPFKVDLRQNVTAAAPSFGLESFVTGNNYRQISVPSLAGSAITLGYSEPGFDEPDQDHLLAGVANGRRFETLSLAGGISENTGVRLGYNVSPADQLALDHDAYRERDLFWSSEDLMSPQLGLVGRGEGGSLIHQVDDATSVSMGWFQGGDDAGLEDDGGVRGNLAQASVNHRFDMGATLGFGFSALDERSSFLNSEANGAFGIATDAQSQFFTLSGRLPIGEWGDWLELQGSFTMGTTEMAEDTSSLLTDWSTVRSNAFGIGVIARGLLADGDRLGVLAGQPLRVYDADATLTLPVARDLAGNVIRESQRVDVTPDGREIDLQLAYDRVLGSGLTLSSWVMMQVEPGHDRSADTAYGGGFKLRFAF
jgi:hypothetical protein